MAIGEAAEKDSYARTLRAPVPHLAAEAWGAFALAVLFVGVTCWWLTQDRSIPIYDAGVRLYQSIEVYQQIAQGHVGSALTWTTPYPPVAYLVGALGIWVGGLGIAPPIVAQNVIVVPLLVLGCYNVGRLAFGARAGLLAAVFALGSPLITAQFHVFMIDAPETAMVAVSIWLILASERFSRVGPSAWAGLAVGLGMLTKEPFVFFVAGVILVTLVRGGWRCWQGLAVFALVAALVALPWYLSEFSPVQELGQAATNDHRSAPGLAPLGTYPPSLSVTNLFWYFWTILNVQLFAPLLAFAVIGGVWVIVGLAQRRAVSPLSWELTVGAFVAWLGISSTFPHDARYSMPLLLYLAVFGTGWIPRLPAVQRQLATGALALVAIVNTLGTSFGVGTTLSISAPGARPGAAEQPGVVTLATNTGYLVAGPRRDGDVLALMRALRRNGVRRVWWTDLSSREPNPTFNPVFSEAGLNAFAMIARLGVLYTGDFSLIQLTQPTTAVIGHGPVEPGRPAPCVTLSDGTGVWTRLGSQDPSSWGYCPLRRPGLYSPSSG
jgi:4-amino-4-deoxy-L-arabinose transferase-like glycosyltransferase